jgi:virulence-associated protein VapD
MSLYPAAQKNLKLAQNIVGMFDQVMGGQEGVDEAKKKRRKKSSRPMGGYFFPGYAYYGGSGEYGDGGGGGESVAEGVNDYLWHGSKSQHDILYPQQANDTGGKEESNKNAIYATPNAKVAIAMGLTTPGSDTGMFPNDPQMVLFKGGIRKGEMIYLHKVPKDLFIKHNNREWYSKPDVKEITPIEIKKIPVDKYLNLIRTATPQDLELQKKYMKKQGVTEGSQSKDDLIWTLNNFDYYTDNGSVYVNDNGDKIARIGSNWKHQSGKMGSGAEELSAFLSSLQDVNEGFGINYPGTYEQENNMFKGHGQRRIGDLTNETSLSESTDYLEEK